MNDTRARAEAALTRLTAWIRRNGWAGYDPYDIKGTPVYMWAIGLPRTPFHMNVVRKLVLGPLLFGEMAFPMVFRKLFRIKPAINAKGMSLLAKAYFNLFKATGESSYKEEAGKCLEWLLAHPSPGYAVPCWGYPFDWESGVVVPAYTPASVVSAAACDAFWTAWEVTGDPRYQKVCEGICEFFLNHLNRDEIDANTLCFSYTPLDRFHVHNVNLMVADWLIRVGKSTGRAEWVTIGEKAAAYALSEQNPDGSLFYWGRVQNEMCPDTIDHYHSGFEMRSLLGIWHSTGDDRYKRALSRYYEFYRACLIQTDHEAIIPKMTPASVYPVNIHSCAEALLLNSAMASVEPTAHAIVDKMLPWVLSKMQAPDGHFIYMRRRVKGIEWPSRIAYWRWGQAWMMLALSQVILVTGEKDRV